MSTECGDSNQDHWSIGQCAALYFDLVGTEPYHDQSLGYLNQLSLSTPCTFVSSGQ